MEHRSHKAHQQLANVFALTVARLYIQPIVSYTPRSVDPALTQSVAIPVLNVAGRGNVEAPRFPWLLRSP